LFKAGAAEEGFVEHVFLKFIPILNAYFEAFAHRVRRLSISPALAENTATESVIQYVTDRAHRQSCFLLCVARSSNSKHWSLMRITNLFFKMVAKRYARDSVVLTRNLPFTQWAGTSPTIRRRRPPCSIAYCIMPTSFRSAAKAIAWRQTQSRTGSKDGDRRKNKVFALASCFGLR
jgi:hypothetical protein